MRVRVAFAFLTSVLATAMLAACGRTEAPAPAQPSSEPLFKPIDPSQAPTVPGSSGTSRYDGVLPCADCSGIRTELTLSQNPQTSEPTTYELTETYLGTMSREEKPVTTRGRWSIVKGLEGDAGATVFVLDGGGNADRARRFERLSDRELRQLDQEGRRITSSLNYVLSRVSDSAAVMMLPPAAVPPGAAAGGVQPPAAMVTDLAAGWPVALAVGQEMTARLAADQASGARWSIRAGSDAGIVTPQGAPASEAPAGQPAVEIFRLKAVRPGKTTLTFDLKKGGDAVRSVSYPVTVQ